MLGRATGERLASIRPAGPVGAAGRRGARSTRARSRSCSAATAPASRPCCNSAPGCCGRSGARVGRPAPPVGWVPERFPADQPFTVTRYLTAMAAVAGLGRARRPAVDRVDRPAGPAISAGPPARPVQGHRAEGRPGPGDAAPARPAGPRRALGGPRRRRPGPGARDDRRGAGRRRFGPGQRPPRRDRPGCPAPAPGRWPTARHGRAAATGGGAVRLVEVAGPGGAGDGTVARLRADGHQILRVRRLRAARGTGGDR